MCILKGANLMSVGILVLITCLLSSGWAVAEEEAENLLNNGGFKDDILDPWVTEGAAGAAIEVVGKLKADVPEAPIEGDLCLHVVVEQKGLATWDSTLKYINLVFEKGKKYTLSAFLKSDDEMQIRFKPQLNMNPFTGYGEQVFTMTNKWQEYHVTTPTMDEVVNPANISFHFNFDVGEFWMDCVKWYEGEYVPAEVGGHAVAPGNKLTTTWGNLRDRLR